MELDLRSVEPEYRHGLVLESFDKLKEEEELTVIADHYPSHLIQLLSGHVEKYKVEQTENGDFVLRLTKKKGESNKAIISHISEFRKTGEVFTPIPVLRKEEYGVILVFFKPSQYIPIHAPNSDLIFYVLQGQGKVTIGNKESEVRDGSIVIVPKGVKRGVKADTYMEALHIVVPSPSPEDHEKVMGAAKKGIAEVNLKH